MDSINLRYDLEDVEKRITNPEHMAGRTLLTVNPHLNSSRAIMFTSHQSQAVNLNEPEIPKVMTNYENIVGKHSTGYWQAKTEYEVAYKIPKFANGKDDNHLYTLILYNRKKDKYKMIQKKIVEDLTEKFGFAYKNDNMDSKEPGDIINEGEVLYSSTSYDKDLNYRYGKNVTVMYTIENTTFEDSICCSQSFADSMVSKEIETVEVGLNDNDILCNIYGDADTYKAFPDIGELVIDKTICCRRRIHNSQLLYDLKKSNLRKKNSNDRLFYNEGRVVDIIIKSNKELDEIPNNAFNKQIKYYMGLQKEYYTKLKDACKEIMESGSKFSNDIAYWYKRSSEILDPTVKWRDENNSIFNNMVIEFQIERNSPLCIGQKITGRKKMRHIPVMVYTKPL